MLSTDETSRLKKAIELQKNDRDEDALSILWNLYKGNPENSKILSILGLVLAKTGKRKQSIPYLEKARITNPKHELLCLSLYISYAEIEEYKKAYLLLFEYLKVYPAHMFKDTLEELLEGLSEGYGTTYKNEILFYAKKNNVLIPEGLE